MNILITAPNLKSEKNISGISSVASLILQNPLHTYYHFCAGKKDGRMSLFLRISSFLITIFRFPIQVSNNNIDLLHLSVPFDGKGIIRELLFASIGRCFKIKVLAHFHGGVYFTNPPKNRIIRKVISLFFNRSSQIIVLSSEEKRTLIESFDCRKPISILSNCIEPLVDEQELNKVILGKEKNSFIYIGRITKEKGMLELVDTLKIMNQKNIQLKFILCGTGSEEVFVKNELKSLANISFSFEGVVWGEKKAELLKKAEYFVLPSHFEGMPISLLEAMSAACVPISTNVGASKLLIENESYGYIAEPQNIKSLFENMNEALKNNFRNDFISRNVWMKIQEGYNSKSYFRQLNDLYRTMEKSE